MTLKPDCASRNSFLDAASSASLVATVWQATISANAAMEPPIFVSVNICLMCFPLSMKFDRRNGRGHVHVSQTVDRHHDQVLLYTWLSVLLPVPQSVHAHRTKSTELLNFDVVGSGGLHRRHQRLSCHLPLTLLGGWMAGIGRRE